MADSDEEERDLDLSFMDQSPRQGGNWVSLMDRRPVNFDSDDDLGGVGGQPNSPKGGSSTDDSKVPNQQSPSSVSLFALIAKFHPEPINIPVHWKPFIPALAPAIGAVDAFVKVPRPDGEADALGLVVVGEPSVAQSNPQIPRMELREQFGVTPRCDAYVGCIGDAAKNRKALIRTHQN